MTVTAAWLLGLAGCSSSAQDRGFEAWIADIEAQRLIQVDGDGPVNELELDFSPSAVLPTEQGLLVADFDEGSVMLLDEDGRHLETWHQNQGTPGAFRLEEPCALLRDGEQVLALGNDTRNVLVMDQHGAQDEIGGGHASPPVRGAHDLVLGPEGLLYIAGSPVVRDQGLVQIWDFERGLVDSLAPWGEELEDATSLSIGPEGELLVVDWWSEQLVLVEDGQQQVLLDADWLDRPVAVRHEADGGVMVLDQRGLLRLAPGALPRRVEVDGLDFPRGLGLVGEGGLLFE